MSVKRETISCSTLSRQGLRCVTMTIPSPGVGRHAAEEAFQGLDPAGGRADADDQEAFGPLLRVVDGLVSGALARALIGALDRIVIGHHRVLFPRPLRPCRERASENSRPCHETKARRHRPYPRARARIMKLS